MLLAQILTDDILTHRQGAPGLTAGSERERLARFADRASRLRVPVLIEGEPGTGAQALARAIHDCGERRARPLVRMNAGDADSGLAALLRHLRDANGGTPFIRDVENLTGEAQDRLFEAIGHPDAAPRSGLRTGHSEVRIIASTASELAAHVRESRFREDLYYRLQVLPVFLPSLRRRREAIGDWATAFLNRLALDEGKRIRALSPDAAALLSVYDWPGNLRQLENAVFRAVVLADGPLLTAAEFPQIAAHVPGFRIEIPPFPQVAAPAPAHPARPPERCDPHALRLVNENGEMRTLAELEAQAIRFALAHYGGHLSAISRRLGIGRSTLYRKLKELGLDDAAA